MVCFKNTGKYKIKTSFIKRKIRKKNSGLTEGVKILRISIVELDFKNRVDRTAPGEFLICIWKFSVSQVIVEGFFGNLWSIFYCVGFSNRKWWVVEKIRIHEELNCEKKLDQTQNVSWQKKTLFLVFRNFGYQIFRVVSPNRGKFSCHKIIFLQIIQFFI